MFNVTVLRMKDILKYMLGLIITLTSIILISKTINSNSQKQILTEIGKEIEELKEKSVIKSLNQTISSFNILNSDNKEKGTEREINKNEILKGMLNTQISSINGIEEIIEETTIAKQKENIEEKNTEEKNIENIKNTEDTQKESNNKKEQEQQNIEIAKTDVKTEVITKNPLKEVYHSQYGNVKIKNETKYELTEEILNPNIVFENKNILIFHTHTCESYTSSEKYPYTQTGNYRTTDLNFSVARVGEELKTQLTEYGHNSNHDKTYHDYPAYNGSYTNSLRTVTKVLNTNPADIVFDIHRDAIGADGRYAPTVKIDGEEAAQIMFVIGTNAGGLEHPNWQQNLKFAIKVQEKAEELYPGLFKPIFLTKSRYNQHTAKYANIIEVGATGNTLEQSINSMKYLAKVLDEVLK